jgi:hypothetical protein
MGSILDFGPLTQGTYTLQASWQHSGTNLLSGAPTSGTGSINFTVVPEPSTLALLGLGSLGLLARRRFARSVIHR